MNFPSAIQILSVLCLTVVIKAFPDGAPSDTCVKKRPNQPNHGQARSQPLDKNPFEVVASSESYHPGQEVTGSFQNISKPQDKKSSKQITNFFSID